MMSSAECYADNSHLWGYQQYSTHGGIALRNAVRISTVQVSG